jgi:AraC-like DNA-binding protein
MSAGRSAEALLARSGLTLREIKNPDLRITVKSQIQFLKLAAGALGDDLLGIRLAQDMDLRELGLLYYVPASSASLGEALRRLARYSGIKNEGVKLRYSGRNTMSVTFEYTGVSRLDDRQQIEFIVALLVRLCKRLAGRELRPTAITLMHHRPETPAAINGFFGCKPTFGASADRVSYPKASERTPIPSADPFLNALLVKYCDAALSTRKRKSKQWRLHVENAIAPLLPHGQARKAEIAQRLGVSQRTLARRLASEGVSFVEVLDNLRFDLAKRYLQEPGLPTSQVGWLLGYKESSAFIHAFKRWTGKTPKQMRQ